MEDRVTQKKMMFDMQDEVVDLRFYWMRDHVRTSEEL